MRIDGKAELIGGVIVRMTPDGFFPGILKGRILRSLADHADKIGFGEAFSSTIVFAVPVLSSGRESFSPDVSFFAGPPPANPMSYLQGAPDFAVEMRSAYDRGPATEAVIVEKRADYFEAGTQIVWDVDPVARIIHSYKAGSTAPVVFRSGEEADAEPAVPGWRVSVDWLMNDNGRT
jgi:Uma2 family endonuclease